MTTRPDTATSTREVKKKPEHGVVRKRSSRDVRGGWEYRLELGVCEAQLCRDCGVRYWLDSAPLRACPACGGELVDVRERRQVTRGGFATQRETFAALAKARVARDGGEDVARKDTNQRVGEFLREWVAGMEGSLKPTTFASYQLLCQKYVIPRLGSIPLRRLTTATINTAYQEIRETGRVKDPSTPLSARSVRHVHAVLRLALKDAVAAGLISHNPAIGAKLPRDRGEAREMQVWSAEQLAAFLESTRSDRLYELWYTAALTGLRRGELVGLRWIDVTWPDEDGQSGRLRIRRGLVSVDGKATISSPKTEAGARDVAIDPGTVLALRSQAARQLDDHDKWGDAWQDTGYVFTIENGQSLHPERVTKLFREAIEQAKLPRIRFHDLRHTHATLGLEAGIPVKVISQRLGHSSTRITQDVYQHVLREQQEAAAAQIADLVKLAGTPAATAPAEGAE
jgi:integrase